MANLKPPVTADDHIQGDPAAEIILVEYGDYECPHCGHAYPIIKRIQQHFENRLAFVYRNFPLSEIHPNAQPAAETAEFAAAQGKFWEMHDAIFENQKSLGLPLLMALANSLDLSETDLQTALDTNKFTPKVQSDFISGVRSGVNGTPTFFINNHRHDAPFEFEDLAEAIQAKLA